jgi:hypothetical protein
VRDALSILTSKKLETKILLLGRKCSKCFPELIYRNAAELS